MKKKHVILPLFCTFLLIITLYGGAVEADCIVPTIYQGVAKIVITNVRPFKNEYLKVDFRIIQTHDALITQKDLGEPLEARILEKPFFKGELKDIPIKCTEGVCEFLKKVNFKVNNVFAIAYLIVDCPDANYIDYIRIMDSEVPPMTGLKSIPIMEVREK